jgi:serine carboxypeptidase-like clade 2
MQIGNAIINDETDQQGTYDYYATHALVSDQVVSQIQKYCDFSPNAGNKSSACNAAIDAVSPNIDNINIYNIYAPICFSTNITARPKEVSVSHNFSYLKSFVGCLLLPFFFLKKKKNLPHLYRQMKYVFNLGIEDQNKSWIIFVVLQILNFDPCSDYYVYAYLNRPDVQEAMHANVTKLTHDWEPCSDVLTTWLDSPSTIIPLLHEFMANGLRVWVFR